MSINYRELLKLYMAHFLDMEGTTYLNYEVPGATEEGMKALLEIQKELREELEDE